MSQSNNIAAIILGAAAAVAILKFFNMDKEDRDLFLSNLKAKTHELLDDAESTVEKIEHFVAEIKSKAPHEWTDKLFIMKRMFNELYGHEVRYLNSL